MPTAAEQVDSTFSLAQNYASTAQAQLSTFLNALNTTIYQPPTLTVTWNSLAPPTLDEMPDAPALPVIAFQDPGDLPGELVLDAPSFTIDDFTEAPPTLTIPSAPTLSYGVAPTVPSIGAVTLPDAPVVTMPDAPTLLTLSTPTFAGVDLREDWLTRLETIPELELVEPTPYTYNRGPEYASALLGHLKTLLDARLNGGTGLPAAVEQALWDRARERETRTALANEAEVMRQREAAGFQLPSGVLAAQLRDAQKGYFDRLSELSRDISIKQADLEQQNLRETITAGIQLESQLITYSYQMEQLAFESAKAHADNAIAVHNAAVERFRALLQGYETYAQAYKTIIDGELAKVEVYKAQMQAEEVKANVNRALVESFKAQIEASLSSVEIYRAQVSAAQTLVQLEQAKIGAAGEQIRAYVAQVNAETAKIEAYKASVTAEQTKVEIYKTKAQAFSARVGAQAERARAEVSRYTALVQAKGGEWDGYRARVAAEGERVRALASQSNALLDGYRAAATATVAKSEVHTKVWETQIKQYEAGQNITLQTAKINNDALIATNNARVDASKVAAQVYSQLTASAYSMINASASISGSAGMSVSYSYSNDTSSTVPPVAAI